MYHKITLYYKIMSGLLIAMAFLLGILIGCFYVEHKMRTDSLVRLSDKEAYLCKRVDTL